MNSSVASRLFRPRISSTSDEASEIIGPGIRSREGMELRPIIDGVVNPRDRFVQCIVRRGTNMTWNGIKYVCKKVVS